MKIYLNQRGLIGKVILISIFLILFYAGYYINQNLAGSIPGDFIYPLKDTRESILLSFSDTNYAQIALYNIEFSKNRMSEINALVEQKKNKNDIINTLKKLNFMQQSVMPNVDNARHLGQYQETIMDQFKAALQDQSDELGQLSVQVEPEVYQSVLDAKFQTDLTLENIPK